MNKKILFNDSLTSLVEFAAVNGNELTSEDVKLYFKDLIEDESQYQFIYDYLTINKIKVAGTIPTIDNEPSKNIESEKNTSSTVSSVEESEEELSFIQMYMNEISAIPPVNAAEKDSLISKLLDGDMSIVERIIECHLSLVAELAQKYRGKGVNFGDLIQDGNMGLMLGVSNYTTQSGDFDTFIQSEIISAFEETVNSQINSNRVGQHLADKLNQLDTITKNLSEELGRVPELSEIADAMGISAEDTSTLLKTSLDTLSINEDTQIADPDNNKESTEDDPLQWRVNNR